MALKWLNVAEAAEQLGVSERTVRRRVARNMLATRKDESNRMWVQVPVAGEAESEAGLDAEAALAEATGDENADSTAPCGAAEAEAESEPAVPAGFAAKAGRYSPLPREARAAFSRPTARLTPGQLLSDAGNSESGPEAELKRYQRLAGASMVLAQRQADDAEEKLVFARADLRRTRKLCIASWSTAAGVALAALFLVGAFGHQANQAQARLDAQREVAAETHAERQALQQELSQMQATLEVAVDRLGEEGSDLRTEARHEAEEAGAGSQRNADGAAHEVAGLEAMYRQMQQQTSRAYSE